MAGKLTTPPTQANHDAYEQNLTWAARILAEENIVGIIEPICSYGVPGYYLNNFNRGINSPLL